MRWTESDIPLQTGKMVVITGANSGLGFYTSLALARRGARVIMACRNLEKGRKARQELIARFPDADLELMELDLSKLSSVKTFAENLLSGFGAPNILINNAGVMNLPYLKTSEGFEMQFGVNHLGHFALSALLWPELSQNSGARLVNVSSAAHRAGKIRFEDIHWEKGYNKWGAYAMSKLANLLFTLELSRRLRGPEPGITVASAHPGYADTSLVAKGMLMEGARRKADLVNLANRYLGQTAAMGALPTLYAACAAGVEQGAFYGPSGFMKMKGWPALEIPNPGRVNPFISSQLWELSEELTGIKFPLLK